MKFTKKEFEAFRKDFNDTLKPLEKKYDLELDENWGITYDSDKFWFKTVFSKRLSEEEKMEREKQSFVSMCCLYGYAPEDYLKTISYNGQVYEFYGFDTKRRKYPCLVRNKQDKNDIICYDAGGLKRMVSA